MHVVSDPVLSKRDLLLLAFLCLLETSIVVILKALHVKGDRSFDVFISAKPGLVFLCAAIVFLIAGVGIINLYLANRQAPSRYFRLIVAMNLVTVLLILVTGEIAVRAGSRIYLDGEAFGNVALVPKNWETTKARYSALIDKSSGDLSYLVYDDQMGWSVGPNRRSANGLYRSSPEGIRVPLEGGGAVSVAEGKTIVALVGDSFTFGEEVRYEETWGYYLDRLLGGEVQVLNFGVPGYGVDQAYLRYEKDARRWKPKSVIFGLFSHDFRRTMTIYPFLAHPTWDLPFSKPRFILSDGVLERLNDPPLPPEAIFFPHNSIFDLPFLELDQGYYKDSAWQHSFYHASYLFRLFVSVFPRWSAVTPDFSEDAIVSINALILKSFVRSAAQEQTIPLLVFFPSRAELRQQSSDPAVGIRALQEASIEYIDATSCIREMKPADQSDQFMPGGHLTPKANEGMAKCLLPFVHQALRQASVGKDAAKSESLPPTKLLDK
jgi:hypothetical protein